MCWTDAKYCIFNDWSYWCGVVDISQHCLFEKVPWCLIASKFAWTNVKLSLIKCCEFTGGGWGVGVGVGWGGGWRGWGGGWRGVGVAGGWRGGGGAHTKYSIYHLQNCTRNYIGIFLRALNESGVLYLQKSCEDRLNSYDLDHICSSCNVDKHT